MTDKILHRLVQSLNGGIPLTVTMIDGNVISPAFVMRLDLHNGPDGGEPIVSDWPKAGGFVTLNVTLNVTVNEEPCLLSDTLNEEPYLLCDIKSAIRCGEYLVP